MKTITVNNTEYEVVTDYKDAVDESQINEIFTDFYKDYDFLVGDIAYSKIRLKGFYQKNNKNVNKINNIDNLDKYLKNNCAVDCKYFVIKKLK